MDVLPGLLGVDLLDRGSLVEARNLAVGGVRCRNREVRRGADLPGHRLDPLEQALDMGAGRANLAGVEVDQLSGEAEPDRAPEVFLDQAVRVVRKRLAFVERAG